MIGAIFGDIAGSAYELRNTKTKHFEMFPKSCHFTDDSVMTIAVADWITNKDHTQKELSTYMREWGAQTP